MLKQFFNYIKKSELYFKLFQKRFPKMRVEGHCLMTGNCCRNLILVNGRKPVSSEKAFKKLKQELPEYEMFQPNGTKTSEGYWRFICSNLTKDNKCGIHETRPDICRNYPDSKILHHGGGLLPGCGYRIVPEQTFDDLLTTKIKK